MNSHDINNKSKVTGFGKFMDSFKDYKDTQKEPYVQMSFDDLKNPNKIQEEKMNANKAFVMEEEKIKVTHMLDILIKYMLSLSRTKCFKEIFLIVMCTCIKITGDLWLGFWSSDILGYTIYVYISFYVIINIAVSVSVLFKYYSVRFGLMRNSDLVYNTLVSNIIYSKFSWFKKIPIADIIYRLTIDTMKIDIDLSSSVVSI